jgi:hypothetical protein
VELHIEASNTDRIDHAAYQYGCPTTTAPMGVHGPLGERRVAGHDSLVLFKCSLNAL